MQEFIPSDFYLSQNYPNPFNDRTHIKYCVAYKARVRITVFNHSGEVIEELVNDEKQPGTYVVEFNTSQNHSGESRKLDPDYYFYRMKAGEYISENKWLYINKLPGRLAMKSLLQTLFFILLVTQICFGQWYTQNSGTTINLKDVIFLDANKGFAIGEGGLIIQTTDGGTTWVNQESGTIISLNSICFIDENNGWIVGGEYIGSFSQSILLHTTNGGGNWFIELQDTNSLFNDICFPSSSFGIIGGGRSDDMLFLRTNDGGVSWVESTIDSIWSFPVRRMCFINVNTGWSIEYHGYVITKTTDGGLTWTRNLTLGGTECGGIGAIDFLDSNYGIIVSGYMHGTQELGNYAKTTNGGETWQKRKLYNDFRDITLLNSDFGIALATSHDSLSLFYVILATYDAGESWEVQFINRSEILNSVYFTDENNGWVVGDNGIILHTTNGGVSFVEEEQTGEMPTEFLLSQNYPNPFNPSTKIKYSIPQTSLVQLKVFDVLGNEIETLINEEKPVGTYELTWNAASLPSGVYFYQLKAEEYSAVKKMILIK